METTPADHVRENTPMHGALEFKLHPAPGFVAHPIYAGFDDGELPGNATYGWAPQSLVSEYAWEAKSPGGRVLAHQWDNGLDAAGRRKLTGFDVEAKRYRGDDYAAVVEYRVGEGKVLVFGGIAVHMAPGGWTGQPRGWHVNRERVRRLTLNALAYLASPEHFVPGAKE